MTSSTSVRAKTVALALGAAVVTTLATAGCSLFGPHGSVTLNMTDAPITASNVSSIYLTINSVDAYVDGSWQTFATYPGGKAIELLTYANGNSIILGSGRYTPGTVISKFRFNLDIPMEGTTATSPGCYVILNNGQRAAIYASSTAGSQIVVGADSSYSVNATGTVDITADFNAQELIYQDQNNGGAYTLRPAVRLVSDNSAGTITGSVSGGTASAQTIAYAYIQGTYASSEANGTASSPPFAHAVTSARVDASGSFTLAYLPEGNYDVVIAKYDSNGNCTSEADVKVGVSVSASATSAVAISLGGIL